MIRRHDLDGVQVLFFLQEFPEVGISGAGLEVLRAPLVGVVGVHDLPAHLPASGTAAVVLPPGGVAQVPSDSVPNAVLAPLHVVVAVRVRVAYRDDLYLRLGEQAPEFVESVKAELDTSGLAAIANFVRNGGTLIAQGDSCWLAEAAGLVPEGTVLGAQRVTAENNTAGLEIVDEGSPLTFSWLVDEIYILDDPLLDAAHHAAQLLDLVHYLVGILFHGISQALQKVTPAQRVHHVYQPGLLRADLLGAQRKPGAFLRGERISLVVGS